MGKQKSNQQLLILLLHDAPVQLDTGSRGRFDDIY